MKWSKLYNPPMLWLLRSPLHGSVSSMYMIVNFTGRKSGKAYSTPVEYWQEDDTFMFFTTRSRVWWRNLQNHAPVTVRVKGRVISGTAEPIDGTPEQFAAALQSYLARFPGREKYFNVRRKQDGSFNADDLAAAAARSIAIRITPD